MTPSRFAELTERLNDLNQRMKRLANQIQGTVPEEDVMDHGTESTTGAFNGLTQVTGFINNQLKRLEECLLDSSTGLSEPSYVIKS